MQVGHKVDDRDLLPRCVGLGRFYGNFFEVRDLLQLEGMRRGGECYDAAQHLSLSERALSVRALTDAIWRSFGCRALERFDGPL